MNSIDQMFEGMNCGVAGAWHAEADGLVPSQGVSFWRQRCHFLEACGSPFYGGQSEVMFLDNQVCTFTSHFLAALYLLVDITVGPHCPTTSSCLELVDGFLYSDSPNQ